LEYNKHEKIANSKKAKREYNYSKLSTDKERSDLKKIALYDFLSKQLYGIDGWYNNLEKDVNGIINWDKIESATLDAFDYTYKRFEKVSKIINNFDDSYMSDLKARANNSYGYGGSF